MMAPLPELKELYESSDVQKVDAIMTDLDTLSYDDFNDLETLANHLVSQLSEVHETSDSEDGYLFFTTAWMQLSYFRRALPKNLSLSRFSLSRNHTQPPALSRPKKPTGI
jgi:hypothetical protein